LVFKSPSGDLKPNRWGGVGGGWAWGEIFTY
jgi:hypothetical protein